MYIEQPDRPQGEAPLKTMICLILDRSGSMGRREDDVIGGVNAFIGANVDAFGEAGELGILGANSAGYTSSSLGTRAMYSSLSSSVRHMRSTGSTRAPDLGRNIGEDPDPPK